LGGKSDNNSNVQKRCAVIFMYDAESALSYEENKNKIRHLYNKRSRYVHEGKKVTASELQDSKLVCNAVTKILFSLRAQLLRLKTAETSEKSIEKWHKNLDLVSAIHEADAIPNASQLELAHISTSQKESV